MVSNTDAKEQRWMQELEKVEKRRRELRKNLQVLRIRRSLGKKREIAKALRKNEKAVLAFIKEREPDFLKKILAGPKKAPAKKTAKKAVKKTASKSATPKKKGR